MTFETWALFAITETALSFTPGPAVLLVLSQGLTRGTGPSIYANLGILSGNACYFALSATGLGAVLLASYELFSAIRWLGAAIEFFVLLAYGALAGRLTSVAARPRFQTLANRVAGTMLVAAGVSVAVQKGFGGPVSWEPHLQGRPA